MNTAKDEVKQFWINCRIIARLKMSNIISTYLKKSIRGSSERRRKERLARMRRRGNSANGSRGKMVA